MPKRTNERRSSENFDSCVEHPRYGSRPKLTGLNPEPDPSGEVFLHWHSPEQRRIPNTAIPADLSRQTPATVPVTHYFDVARKCRDCERPFIFFAEEQKYWYEDLGFPLESDCVRCFECRRAQRGIALKRERYEELFRVSERTAEEYLEMAECCLSLIETSVFTTKQVQRIRMLLNSSEPHLTTENRPAYEELRARLSAVETEDDKGLEKAP
jgi:hypothetical protein